MNLHSSVSSEGLVLALERINRALAVKVDMYPSQDEYEWDQYQRATMAQERTTIRAELLRRGVATTLTQGLDKVLC